MLSLFDYLRAHNGSEISVQSLSQQLGANMQTIHKYLDVLELMGIIYVISNSTNALVRENSRKKVYVNSLYGLRETKYDWPTALGFSVESYVLERLLERGEMVTFYRKRNKEIDFLLPQKKLAYEVKYRGQVSAIKPILKGYTHQMISLSGTFPACLE